MGDVQIREWGAPGDLGWVLKSHGELYAAEYGFDHSFEQSVSRTIAGFAQADPARRRGWIAELDGRRIGSIACPPSDIGEDEVAQERRRLAAERRERMAAGDERYLLPRDRGPVKAYIRDVVDSRPHLMGLFMPLAGLVLISALFPVLAVQQYMSLFTMIVLLVMIVEGVLLGISTTRKVRAKFPNEQIRGLSIGWYAFTRASQLRRLRIPKPRVQRGANV